jgi:hypothetical protein
MKRLFTLFLIFTLSLSGVVAQLPETELSISAVKADLGANTYELSALATHININKWSRKKPVDGTWPQSSTLTYGLDLANNWAYIKPTTEYRLGDFRGYQNNATIAVPPIHVLAAESETDDLYPYGNPTTNTHTIRAYRIATYTSVILPSLFTPNLDNYYYGFKITKAGSSWYKTYALVSSLDATGINIGLDATIIETTPGDNDWHFNDLPQGVGTYTWATIIASSAVADWSISAPTNVYTLPSGTFSGLTYASSGSFTVHEWLVPSPQEHNWTGLDEDIRESTIYIEDGSVWAVNTGTIPAWITYDVGYYLGEPAEWTSVKNTPADYTSGKIIRFDPAAPDVDRSAVVGLQISSIDVGEITLNQSAVILPPAFSVIDSHSGLVLTDNNTSGAHGDLSLTVKYTVSGFTSETDIYIRIYNQNSIIGTSAQTVFSNGDKQITVNLSQSLQNGLTYKIALDDAQ